MSKNKKNGGNQAPAQRHAEGQHGQKTTDFLRKQHVAGSRAASKNSGPARERAGRQADAKRKS